MRVILLNEEETVPRKRLVPFAAEVLANGTPLRQAFRVAKVVIRDERRLADMLKKNQRIFEQRFIRIFRDVCDKNDDVAPFDFSPRAQIVAKILVVQRNRVENVGETVFAAPRFNLGRL